MSVFYERQLVCPSCETRFPATVARSVNASRHAASLQRLHDRQFHRFACPGCDRVSALDVDFLYADPAHRRHVLVRPHADLGDAARWEGVARRAVYRGYVDHPWGVEDLALLLQIRLVFGTEGLREKVVIWKAGLDDAVVEVVKLRLLLTRPDVIGGERHLLLDEVTPSELVWRIGGGQLATPLADYERALAQRAELVVRHGELFASAWCDIRRSPLWSKLGALA